MRTPGRRPVAAGAIAVPFTPARWLRAAIRTTRPRQWPKNLLVFAAPLAAASLGRDHGFDYALLAMFAFASRRRRCTSSTTSSTSSATGGTR